MMGFSRMCYSIIRVPCNVAMCLLWYHYISLTSHEAVSTLSWQTYFYGVSVWSVLYLGFCSCTWVLALWSVHCIVSQMDQFFVTNHQMYSSWNEEVAGLSSCPIHTPSYLTFAKSLLIDLNENFSLTSNKWNPKSSGLRNNAWIYIIIQIQYSRKKVQTTDSLKGQVVVFCLATKGRSCLHARPSQPVHL